MLITAGRRMLRDSLARNSLLIMATTVANGGLGYFYWMLAARAVPQSAIGTSTALISAATAVSMIANLGAGHMFIQRLPGSDTAGWSRIVSGGLLFGTAATVAVATTGAVMVPAVAGNFSFLAGSAGATALICAAVAVTLTTLLDNVYVAHRSGYGMLVRNLALASGKILALLAVLGAGAHSAGAVLISWTLPTLLVSAGTIVAGLGRLRPGARLSPAGIAAELPHLRTALTGHHLINLTQAGPAALLPVLVTVRLGPHANAHFYLAWMTASMLFMVSPAVASALYAERTNAARVSIHRAAAVVLAVVGLPATVLVVAGDRILAQFSEGYADGGGLLLKILVIAALPDAITNLAVAHWRSRGEFRRCRRLNLVRAVTCVCLTWVLLPGAGVTGAGIAWLAGQSAAALLVILLAVARRPADARRPAGSGGCCAGSPTAGHAGSTSRAGAECCAEGPGTALDAGSNRGPSAAMGDGESDGPEVLERESSYRGSETAVAPGELPGTGGGAVEGAVAVLHGVEARQQAGGDAESPRRDVAGHAEGPRRDAADHPESRRRSSRRPAPRRRPWEERADREEQ